MLAKLLATTFTFLLINCIPCTDIVNKGISSLMSSNTKTRIQKSTSLSPTMQLVAFFESVYKLHFFTPIFLLIRARATKLVVPSNHSTMPSLFLKTHNGSPLQFITTTPTLF